MLVPSESQSLGSLRSLSPVRCLPLTDLLLAIGRPHVDYLSLDVEGFEGRVLSGLDLSVISVDIFTIEVPPPKQLDSEQTLVTLEEYRKWFGGWNRKLSATVTNGNHESGNGINPPAYLEIGWLPVDCKLLENCLDVVYARREAFSKSSLLSSYSTGTVTNLINFNSGPKRINHIVARALRHLKTYKDEFCNANLNSRLSRTGSGFGRQRWAAIAQYCSVSSQLPGEEWLRSQVGLER